MDANIFTTDLIEKLSNYPTLLALFFLCWLFYKIILKMLDKLPDKEDKRDSD